MATKGALFGAVHSANDLSLILQKFEIRPATPKTDYKNVPGADGAKDLTEALGVGVRFNDQELKWTFALYPGTGWAAKRSEVSNAINGKACHIVPDDDPAWYYDGRVEVSDYKTDKLLRQITVKAVCRPYKRKLQETTVTRDDLTTSYKDLNLSIGAMPLIPSITVAQETTLQWGDLVTTVNDGTHLIPGLYMSGPQTVKAKLTTGSSGTITVTWREGSL